MNKNKCYFLGDKFDKSTAFAYGADDLPVSYELIPELRNLTEIPFEMNLKNAILGKSGMEVNDDISTLKYHWLDFQPNNFAWPLMSEKMKNIIETNLTGKEEVLFMRIKVNGAENEQRNYYVPRFTKKLDVLDKEKTIFVKGTSRVVIPKFSSEKISNYNLFFKPQMFWEMPSGIYVTDQLKNAMEGANLTGMKFENATVI